ncbi:GIY-YIG nuclease family protein [Nostoc sp. 'Peltigera membranacea cyanobiont' N6]|uniref:GIY-YIG nuclease family protein n=1 Tax=Nostoc sp. 'Peltigera membranacea cyanobiont' N6 TaxID=1261031 RepID=UPI000CF35F6E|nr:GIY-YIG nuclease family protein [Nostoc sp. 'Peltigera membranacea cyanobiont' N6]AVH68517.1 GIY-YIG nuclease domain protein [Nostoc sp. 'Peltigera membranacea cyanobiont' N6]
MEWETWQSLPFKQRCELPTISGIYTVVDYCGNVWYVGQAVNLNARWLGKGHHRYPQLNRSNTKWQYRIYWKSYPLSELNQKEQYYIDLFQPSINRTKVKKYSLGKPQLKIEVNKSLDNVQFVYFRGNPNCYEDISQEVGVFTCTLDEQKNNVAIEKNQVIKGGHAYIIAIRYEIDGQSKTTQLLCSKKKHDALSFLRGLPYRGGKIINTWIPLRVIRRY